MTSLIPAPQPEFVLEKDGFAVIQTFTLTKGQICRKIDRYLSPIPLAWHTRDDWGAIYLSGGTKDENNLNKMVGTPSGPCQSGISQRTLVGPLKKGKWQIYGSAPTTEVKAITFSEVRQVANENNTYDFNLEKSAVVTAYVQFYHNASGGCHEYVPLTITPAKEKNPTAVQVLEVKTVEAKRIGTGGGLCRALPQTIGHGAVELQPGTYRISGPDLKRVVVFAQK